MKAAIERSEQVYEERKMAEEMLAKVKEDTRQERDEFKVKWNELGRKIEEEKTKCEQINNKKNQKADQALKELLM